MLFAEKVQDGRLNKGMLEDAQESWTDEERQALAAHIEEGYGEAERGNLIDSAQARRDIQALKDDWRLSKR